VKHAQAGQSISPALSWTNVPMGTVEFVLIMNDPEPVSPRGSATGDILHWMVAKIPATVTSMPEGPAGGQPQLPAGARQIAQYRGPGAPAAGPPHHYTLTLYALNAPARIGRECGPRCSDDGDGRESTGTRNLQWPYKAPAPPPQ
jgi:Raf kinase inhibitor-like YbhB/YbcL family protein